MIRAKGSDQRGNQGGEKKELNSTPSKKGGKLTANSNRDNNKIFGEREQRGKEGTTRFNRKRKRVGAERREGTTTRNSTIATSSPSSKERTVFFHNLGRGGVEPDAHPEAPDAGLGWRT